MAELEGDTAREQGPGPHPETGPAAPGAPPPRRAIPLPPGSLRPPPRRRRGSVAGGDGPGPQAAVLNREKRRGSRRGFLIGLGVSVLGCVLAGLVFLPGRPGGIVGERGRESGPDVLVRARLDRGNPVTEPVPPPEAETGGGAVPDARAPTTPLLSIQVASFRTVRRAEAVLDAVSRRTGLPGVVLPTEVDGVRWQRILLGAFASESEARQAARPLIQDGTITEILIRPAPERWTSVLTGGASP